MICTRQTGNINTFRSTAGPATIEFSKIFLALATDLPAGARNDYRDVIDQLYVRSKQLANGRGFRDVGGTRRAKWQRVGMAAVIRVALRRGIPVLRPACGRAV